MIKKAFILAAGRGQRLRPLSDTVPKPLLKIADLTLIEHHLKNLAQANIQEVVINVSHLADKIQNYLGDGSKWGIKIHYSYEAEALESGGGIFQALPFLGSAPFILISCDIYTDYPFSKLKDLPKGLLAHLILSPSEEFPKDFHLDEKGKLHTQGSPKYTYGGIGLIHPDLFIGQKAGRFRIGPLFFEACDAQKVTGELYQGRWENITSLPQYEKICDKIGAEQP